MILFALRNNVLTFLFGISFERALLWHRAAARLTIILAVIHAYKNFKEDSIIGGNKLTGIPMLVLLITASLSYFIKAKSFELFYYFHIISYLTVVILGFIHGATVFSLSVIIWGFDMLVRYYFAVNKVQAEMVSLPGAIVCVKFPKVFDYSPGQYCFISVPQLSYYQFHVRIYTHISFYLYIS
jgi:NADPH oxidase